MLAGALSLSFGFYWLMTQTTPAQMHVRLAPADVRDATGGGVTRTD